MNSLWGKAKIYFFVHVGMAVPLPSNDPHLYYLYVSHYLHTLIWGGINKLLEWYISYVPTTRGKNTYTYS